MERPLPSYNLASEGSSAGMMEEILRSFAMSFESCLPAIVESYDRATHIATVQPAISIVSTLGDVIDRAPIKCSVWRFMCGGYLIDAPLVAGDTGWIIASDRESSLFKQTSAVSKPNTKELHKYSAGFFVPDKFGAFTIAAEDANNLVIQNTAGTEKISIGTSGTKITSTILTINAPTVTMTGNLVVNGLDILTHRHSGVSTGSGTSGTPVP